MTLLHERIRAASRALAGMIEAGRFSALSEAERCDLRAATLEMQGWADEAYELECPITITPAAYAARKERTK